MDTKVAGLRQSTVYRWETSAETVAKDYGIVVPKLISLGTDMANFSGKEVRAIIDGLAMPIVKGVR